jgi:hypothetical protein
MTAVNIDGYRTYLAERNGGGRPAQPSGLLSDLALLPLAESFTTKCRQANRQRGSASERIETGEIVSKGAERQQSSAQSSRSRKLMCCVAKSALRPR